MPAYSAVLRPVFGLCLKEVALMTSRILMIVTSNNRLGHTGKATGKTTGIWAEELAEPYIQFVDAGVQVDIASPAGGAAPLDAASVKPAGSNAPSVERFLADATAQTKLQHTLKASDVNAADYNAIFFPGGHGTMWDLPQDDGVRRAVEAAYAARRVIGSVCHGAAGLVSARRADGKAVVEGHRINSFTDAEEAAVGLTEVVPFLLESRLRELGARFEGAPNWQAFSVHDGVFVTGQNPQSSALVAQGVLTALALPLTSAPRAPVKAA
jgi:putative intracellular protease/amidase